MSLAFRIGHGYDVHRLKEGRALVLGGVCIPHKTGLLGHSDADVLLHAVMDAVFGAIGLGDIGRHFPDSDPAYKDISSICLASHVRRKMEEAGYAIGNIDATVIAEAPRLAPYLDQMRKNIAAVLACEEDSVNIKATTEEGLGFSGKEEGIAAHAVCLCIKK